MTDHVVDPTAGKLPKLDFVFMLVVKVNHW